MQHKYSFIVIVFFLLFGSCSKNEETVPEKDKFTRIYDFDLWGGVYNTLDAKQTVDGGYVALANLEDAPYLIKTKENGDFEWDTWHYSTEYPSYIPVPSCIEMNNEYYFYAYSYGEDTKPAVLMKVNANTKTPQIVKEFGAVNENRMPFYSLKNSENEILLLTGHPTEGKVVLNNVDLNGEVLWSVEFNYNSDISIEHPSKEKRFHHMGILDDETFYCNTYSGSDIVTHIIDRTDGFIYDEISHIYPITSIAFLDDDTYVTGFPIWDIYGIQLPETDDFVKENIVSSINNSSMSRVLVNEKEYAVFASNSRDNQMMVKIFNPYNSSKTAKSFKKFYGNTYFYNAGGTFQTPDGGLLIYGNAYVMGRIGRIFLIKLSKQELETMVEGID